MLAGYRFLQSADCTGDVVTCWTYVSVGVTLGQMYTDSEITATLRRGAVRDACTKPFFIWRYAKYFCHPSVDVWSSVGLCADYQLEQQSQSELDVRQLRAKNLTLTITDE